MLDASRVASIAAPTRCVLRVTDDGIGMNGSLPGGGLRGMRERAVIVGATLEIRSEPVGGAEITMRMPVAAGGA